MTTLTADPRTNSVQSAGGLSGPAVLPVRLVSLDAYRGFVMLLMASGGLGIAAVARRPDHATRLWQFLAGQVDHVQWRGCGLWDLIQPSFSFIVGVAMPFSLAKRRSQGQSFGRLFLHALWRSLLLIWLGIFLRSRGQGHTNFTFEDTLSQIGLGYSFLFLMAWTRPGTQIFATAFILFAYWLAFAVYPLSPAALHNSSVGVSAHWHAQYGLTGFAAHWDKNTNFGAAFDKWFLNLFPHSSAVPFNSGGYLTLSFIPTLATMVLGLLAGELLRSRRPHEKKFWILVALGFFGLIVGMVLDRTGACPVVKRIWTPSWTIYSAGWCCLLLAAFYGLVDWGGWRGWSFPLVVVGMNSIAMYCMADGGFKAYVTDSFHTNLGRHFFDWAHALSPIAESAAVLLVLWLVCFWMYRRKIFLRI